MKDSIKIISKLVPKVLPKTSDFGIAAILELMNRCLSGAWYQEGDCKMAFEVFGKGSSVEHTAIIYAPDKDGVYMPFGADKPVWQDGRYISEDEVYAIASDDTLLIPPPSLKYQPSVENLCPDGTIESAQTITLTNIGKYMFAVFGPAGSDATIAADTAVGTGFGTATPGNPIEVDITTEGDVTITATLPEAINLLEMPLVAGRDIGPIYTNGTPASTDRTAYKYAPENFDNSNMSLYCEVKPQGGGQVFGSFLSYGLGNELIANNQFIDWADPTVPDGWAVTNLDGTTKYVEESPSDTLHFHSDDADWCNVNSGFTRSNVVLYVKVDEVSEGAIRVYTPDNSVYLYESGLFVVQADMDAIVLATCNDTGCVASDYRIGWVSARAIDGSSDFCITDYAYNCVSLPGNINAWNKVGIAIDADAGVMQLYVNGTWSAETPYSGQLEDLTQYVELFIQNQYPGQIRNIEIKCGGTLENSRAFIEKKADIVAGEQIIPCGLSGWTCTVNSFWTGYPCDNMWNCTASGGADAWVSEDQVPPPFTHTITNDLGNAAPQYILTRIEMRGRVAVTDDHQDVRRPDPLVLKGSNDGTVWEEITRFTNTGPWAVGETKAFQIFDSRPYRHFQVIWEDNGGPDNDGGEMGWCKLYGYLYEDPREYLTTDDGEVFITDDGEELIAE